MTYRVKALRFAVGELGVKESPPGSNSGPRVREYQAASSLEGTGWPWCMAFVCWCYKQAGYRLPYPTASVGGFLDWARKEIQRGNRRIETPTRPFRGDLVCYRFDADNWPDHVGIVERVLALPRGGRPFIVRTVEGNTAFGDDADGGQVQRRTRWHSRCTYVRILEPKPAAPRAKKPTVRSAAGGDAKAA